MSVISDNEIHKLLSEPKPLPENYLALMKLRDKKGHREKQLDIKGDNGNYFRIIIRQSQFNILDFSVILAYQPEDTNQPFLLRRYNGRSHEHTNSIEQETFFDFHIHQATERYQEIGAKETAYAEPSDKYHSIEEAFECMIRECSFIEPSSPQPKLL